MPPNWIQKKPNLSFTWLWLWLRLAKGNAATAAERAQSSGASENADFNDALGGVFQELGRQNEALQCLSRL